MIFAMSLGSTTCLQQATMHVMWLALPKLSGFPAATCCAHAYVAEMSVPVLVNVVIVAFAVLNLIGRHPGCGLLDVGSKSGVFSTAALVTLPMM